MTADAFAAQQAETWQKGLADWGEDGARIERLRKAAEFAIYTPAAAPGSPSRSCSRSPRRRLRSATTRSCWRERAAEHGDQRAVAGRRRRAVREAASTRSSSTCCRPPGRPGKDLDLASLIQQIQSPPFQKVGVVDLEAFFPRTERFELAMQFNAVARRARIRAVVRR